MLPSRPCRMSASVGFGLVRSSSYDAMIMPGVQYPHCSPCLFQKPCCSGCSEPAGARPSMVVTAQPSAGTARQVHDRTAIAATNSVQAPDWLVDESELATGS